MSFKRGRAIGVVTLGLVLVAVVAPSATAGASAHPAASPPAFYGSTGSLTLNKPIVGMAATPDGRGYWLVASDGGIFSYGDAGFSGSTGSLTLNKPIVGMAATPDGQGYWLVASDGGIFSYGDAGFSGSTGSLTLNRPIVGMAATPDGKGYWLVASDGGIFSYGTAAFYGSTGSLTLNRPIVGMAATPDGKGYWLVASDGGIFSYGDAAFYGSTGSLTLNRPIVGMAATSDGKGYWLVASDGGIFSYGDAAFFGSTGSLTLNRPMVGMATSASIAGYWLVASDGGIFALGPGSTTTAPSDEFSSPSWTGLPAASSSNTTPSCPLTAADNWVCTLPASAWPPADPFNPERYLNSAYWPAEKRPDIEMYAIQQYGYGYQNCSSRLPHYCFLTDAEAVGYPITHTPAVGDLWVAPGECLSWEVLRGAVQSPSTCNDATDTDWYMGYVEQVFPDGSFVQSWGGSTTPADSGLQLTEFSPAMNPSTDFIAPMPPGSPKPALRASGGAVRPGGANAAG